MIWERKAEYSLDSPRRVGVLHRKMEVKRKLRPHIDEEEYGENSSGKPSDELAFFCVK
jgi:hypothetical protein